MIEGIIKPNSVEDEGPFGEFPGYYGRPEAGCPLVEITAVHYRNNPILTNALDGGLSIQRAERLFLDHPLGAHLGRLRQARHTGNPGRLLPIRRVPAVSA